MSKELEYIPLSKIRDADASHASSYDGYGAGWESLGRERGGFKQYSDTARIKSGTHWRILSIVGGLLIALGFATGHHFYLSSLANTDVRLTRSQFW
ncbi:hypothetical protein FRC17_005735, partial [Serendipita sp. 399]